ncbi:MAG TPA: prepilin-type N-terminal cleavage/methylation domain-containing protein [Acidocella sp.]|uniref:prepilin-type N-terminal cleavage/methylation domain-containing protein n=1 Tax=Acidocella sp. TaxID=50710 RepID=UPI002C25FD41|nr:prepilin-type N-terminal cleavage/methylation domain-containing protein [Acidocella sp.]HVE20519.1 prepilin-type N-terminal cleavage/methylation domain-containing protein [Acidocella sp.]
MSPSSHTERGFTLLEMLITIVVMGLMMLLITGYAQPHSHRLEVERAAQRVAAVMRQDRGLAIATGRPVRVTLPALPGWLSVIAQFPKEGLIFAPDGSSSGGTVLLAAPGMRSLISANWLTGQISIRTK